MRRRTIFWILALAALLAVFAYHFQRKLSQLNEVQLRLQECQATIRELEGRMTAMARELGYLGTDAGIEALAREKLGLVRRNETIFIIEPTPVPPPRPSRPAP
ncbi:MAG: septum formation initiator family protein [Candidatus Aureabacteria bacterium]|nr:septum formation initiator family protein [Candidatus Auribacterota bacterium]